MSLQTIQTILDENKEQLPDGLYKQLCDATKRGYEAEKKNKSKLYEVKLLAHSFRLQDDREQCQSVRLLPRGMKIICPLEQNTVEAIEREIQERGFAWGLGVRDETLTLSLPTSWIVDDYDDAELPKIVDINIVASSIICAIKEYEH